METLEELVLENNPLNGFDGAIKAAESLKEQRAERHLELQKRICNAELVSPSRPPAALSPCSPDRGDGGSISPLKFTPGGTDNGEDMFARELQKQKYDYEQRKKKAEQAKFEGGVRKPSRVHTASPVVPGSAPVGQLPQPPVRSASVNVGNSSSILHGYNNGSVLKNPSLFSHHYFHPKQEGVESELKHTFEQNLDRSTDSHRSSPSSLTSQESDHRVSSLSSRVSSGTPEPHITSKPPLAHSTQDNSTHKLPTRNSHKSAAAAPKDSVDAAVSRHTPTKVSSAVGFQSAGSLGRGVKLPSRPVNGNEHSTADSSPQSGKSSTKPVGEASHISDIKEIIESRLKVTLPKDVMGELKDGVILCHLANHIKPRTVSQIHVKSSAVPKLTMAKCKRNVENFLEACRRLGVPQEQLCSQADIIDEKRPAPLLCTLQALVDLKTALAKSATCAQTAPNSVHSRPNSRSKSSQPGPSSRSLSNRTTSSSGKQRSHPPLHSVV
ncbi:LRCH3 [Bugula neritina]|uniref:LRCH3 n=1 Tax=Bugula neritina TaxID=10212 RepID=A0A7J7K0Y2_BUGNE|nr:LRCH3 [Bugula neritina]